MDTTNFWHLLDDLLRNLATDPLQRLWPWPLIAAGLALALAYGSWRLLRPCIAALEQKGAGPAVFGALLTRLLPSGLVVATSLAGYWTLRAAAEYAEALAVLTRQAMALMERAASSHLRVEKEPAPAARLVGFAENGIDLELRFWIRDPEDGVNNIRSDVYLEIWDAFKAATITFPYPQRDVYLHGPEQQT